MGEITARAGAAATNIVAPELRSFATSTGDDVSADATLVPGRRRRGGG